MQFFSFLKPNQRKKAGKFTSYDLYPLMLISCIYFHSIIFFCVYLFYLSFFHLRVLPSRIISLHWLCFVMLKWEKEKILISKLKWMKIDLVLFFLLAFKDQRDGKLLIVNKQNSTCSFCGIIYDWVLMWGWNFWRWSSLAFFDCKIKLSQIPKIS